MCNWLLKVESWFFAHDRNDVFCNPIKGVQKKQRTENDHPNFECFIDESNAYQQKNNPSRELKKVQCEIDVISVKKLPI